METVKHTLGLDKSEQQQGQEPVSGEQGQGTATDPFDAGNKEEDPSRGGKAPQDTDPTQVTGETTTATAANTTTTPAAPAADSAQSTGEPAPPASSSSGATKTPSKDPSKKHGSKKPSIGSSAWFKTAIPFGKRKTSAAQPSATAVSTNGASETPKDTRLSEPPSHAPGDVSPKAAPADVTPAETKESETKSPPDAEPKPESATPAGATTIFSKLNPFASPDQPETEGAAPAAGTASEANNNTAAAAATTATDESAGPAPKGSEAADADAAAAAEPKKNKGKEKEKPPPREVRGSNPSAIPLAGGKPVGSGALDKRKSAFLVPADLPKDPEIIKNTAANVGENAKPPESKTGEKSVHSGDVPDTVAKESNLPANGPRDSAKGSPPTNSKEPEKVARRRSVIDRVKDFRGKFSGGKKEKE